MAGETGAPRPALVNDAGGFPPPPEHDINPATHIAAQLILPTLICGMGAHHRLLRRWRRGKLAFRAPKESGSMSACAQL